MSDKAGDSRLAEMSFEEALAELEGIVDALERGDVPLDKSIDLYERGNDLRKVCQKRLDDAQMRIDKIITDQKGEAAGAEPLDKADSAKGPSGGLDEDTPF